MGSDEIIYYAILLAGAVIGLTQIRRSEEAGRWLTVLFLYLIVKELAAKFCAVYYHSNLGFYRITGIIDFVITTFVLLSIPVMHALKKAIYALAVGVILFYLVIIIKWEPQKGKADIYFELVNNFVLVCYALLLMKRIYESIDEESIFRKSAFWIAISTLLFYCVSIVFWGSFNYYVGKNSAIMGDVLTPLYHYANYVLYASYAVAVRLNNFN
jgi:hypothetical protein